MREQITSSRDRFTKSDFDFIMDVLGGTPEACQALEGLFTDKDVLNQLLDSRKLFQVVIESPKQLSISPDLYFYILVRQALLKVSLDDRGISDYVASILRLFVQVKNVFPQELQSKRSLFYVIDYLEKIQHSNLRDQFYYTVHLANLSLFLAGVFPDHIALRVERYAAPDISYYDSVAQMQYGIAKDFRFAKEQDLDSIFEKLSVNYMRVREGLNLFQDRFVSLYQYPEILKLLEESCE